MTTFGELINDTENYLYSYGMMRDKVTTLINAIGTDDIVLTLEDAGQVDRGYLEIDQELMAVASLSASARTVTLHPWGRGQRGTQAAAHTAGSKVVISPRFPRSVIAGQIQKTIASLYADGLYRVQVDESQSYSAARVTYPIPDAVGSIISVSYEPPGPSRMWVPLYRWRVNQSANLEDFSTGKSLDLYEAVLPGRPLRIVYRTDFGKFGSEATPMASIGLQDRWADVIVLGACASLVLGTEAGRLQSDAVETQERAEGVQPTQATTVARQLLGMFKQRIMEERSVLQRLHPPVMTRQF